MSKNFKQYNTEWAKLGYPKKPWYIKDCGCGEVAIANVIVETDAHKSDTPKTIQPWCKQFAAPNGDGTYWGAPPKMMAHYGLTECQEHQTMNPLWKELAKGNRVAIYLMSNRLAGSKKIKWTGSKHFICSTDYKYDKKTGKHWVYVKDSNSTSESRNGWISYEDNLRNAVFKVWSGKLPKKAQPAPKKSIDTIAKEVIDGKWGNGDERIAKLKAAGYDPSEVQRKVNEIIASRKTIDQLAQEVIDGKWGSGNERKKRLTEAGYDYDAVQKRVNEILSKETWVDKANAWAKKIAADNSYHYLKWTSDAKTHQCPICHNVPKGKYHGWNCIGFAFACWHHGGGLPNKCNNGVVNNKNWNDILNAKTDAEALAIAKKRTGLKDIKVIRNKKGIPKTQWKAGDILGAFKSGKYYHTIYYMGNGQIAESTGLSGKTPVNNQIRIKSYSKKSACAIIRYTGK